MFPETTELPFQFPQKINFRIVTAPLYKRISWFFYVGTYLAGTIRLILKEISLPQMDHFKYVITKPQKSNAFRDY